MRKSIVKILVLGVSLIFLTNTAYANEVPELTVTDATNRAIRNSSQIRAAEDNILNVSEEEARARDVLWNNPMAGTADVIRFQTSMLALDLERAINNTSIAMQRAGAEILITNHFANIIMAQNELALFDENLRILEREVEIANIRYNLGLAGSADVQSARHNLSVTVNNRANLQNSLDASFRELNRAMGVSHNSQNRVYDVILDLEFEPMGDINLQRYINQSVQNDARVQGNRGSLEISTFQLDNRMLMFDPMTGAVTPGQQTRAQAELNVTQAERELSDTIQSVENSVIDLYNQIRNLELVITATEIQLAVMLQENAIVQVHYSTGNITRLDVERSNLGVANMQETLRRQKINHSIMVMQLTNPYL